MADEEKTEETTEEGAEGSEGKSGKKRLIILIAIAVLVLGGGAAGAFFFLGSSNGDAPAEEEKTEETAEEEESEEGDEGEDEGEEGEDEDEESQEDGAEEGASSFGKSFPLKAFNLNLGNPLDNRFVRLEVSLEYKGGEKQKSELESRTPQLRDAVIDVTSRKTREFLLSPDGKDQLRLEIQNRINRYLKYKIEGVYITDILIE